MIEGSALFDTGTGLRDISEVVAALTDLAAAVLSSHLHYDHVGNLHRFVDLALVDLPLLRGGIADLAQLLQGLRDGTVWAADMFVNDRMTLLSGAEAYAGLRDVEQACISPWMWRTR